MPQRLEGIKYAGGASSGNVDAVRTDIQRILLGLQAAQSHVDRARFGLRAFNHRQRFAERFVEQAVEQADGVVQRRVVRQQADFGVFRQVERPVRGDDRYRLRYDVDRFDAGDPFAARAA